jgi:beta-1,4-galactosyltransferase 1
MLIHKKEVPSSARLIALENGVKRFDSDGISDLEYKVLNHQLRPLYSWILVDI